MNVQRRLCFVSERSAEDLYVSFTHAQLLCANATLDFHKTPDAKLAQTITKSRMHSSQCWREKSKSAPQGVLFE